MATKLGKIVADFSTTLATAIAVGGTTLTLQSIVDDDGNNIPDGNYYFTIDGNNSSKEHIYCTISGASVSSIVSVSRQGVTASGVVRAHRVGAQVVITDFAHIMRMNNLFLGVDRLDATNPLRYDGTATISNANDLATKAYVDGVAIAGAPDASTTVKGITKMSVAPASATSPIAVGDNDPRMPTQAMRDALAGTGTPSGSNKFVTADTDALKELLANKDTDGTLAANSDTKYPSQKAIKTYVDGLTGVASFASAPTDTTLLSSTQNVDTTFTPGFLAKNITIYYRLRGTTASASVYSYGHATFNATTLQSNYILKNNVATDTITGGVLTIDTSNPTAGVNGANGTLVTLTITSVTSTQFTVRAAFTVNNSTTGQAVFYAIATK
jgi:hypothetical protein